MENQMETVTMSKKLKKPVALDKKRLISRMRYDVKEVMGLNGALYFDELLLDILSGMFDLTPPKKASRR